MASTECYLTLASRYYDDRVEPERLRCAQSCYDNNVCFGVAYHKGRQICYVYNQFPHSPIVDVGMVTFLPEDASYRVEVKTGDASTAKTDAKAYVRIYGSYGDTGPLQLDQSLNHSDPFHRNYIDTFILTAPVIGQMEKIKIGHDNSGLDPGWYLDTVTIDIPYEGRRYVFVCNRWLTEFNNGSIEKELQPTSSEGYVKGNID
ncbi:hypothetical protein LOTGIDRAFT_174808 [Lottia gigantea]|uniref:PLAT domain-containing protein n=1 Tax=Lottia gigantea TaxID=225164 RepID=V4AI33_LOTGI|nr:hypothetical protein LOTGIDRAFT_174808 [Lottia gigantea]ESO96577.1 hypothetical protein LOTGIDRAFT_174808 [Lottia gigantea]